MSNQESESLTPSIPLTPIDEEQFLCNEALRTGVFDRISERDWVTLCEKAYIKGRRESAAMKLENVYGKNQPDE